MNSRNETELYDLIAQVDAKKDAHLFAYIKSYLYETRWKYEKTDFRMNKEKNKLVSNIGKSHYI